MEEKTTHITLMNKKERFTFHLGDLIVIGLFYVLLLILLDAIFSIDQNLDYNVGLYSSVYFFYFLFFESIYGTSPVKMNYARVIDVKGEKPSFVVILLRTFCRFIPFDSISFLLMKRGSGLHDVLSRTQIVRKFKKK